MAECLTISSLRKEGSVWLSLRGQPTEVKNSWCRREASVTQHPWSSSKLTQCWYSEHSLLFIQTRVPPKECCYPRLGWLLLPLLIQPRYNLMGTPLDLFPRWFEISSNWGYEASHLYLKPFLVPLPQTEPAPDNRPLTMGPRPKPEQGKTLQMRAEWTRMLQTHGQRETEAEERRGGFFPLLPPTSKSSFNLDNDWE